MARTTKPLTATQINNAKPKLKEYSLSDGKGLFLLIKPNGSKLWRFNYYKPLSNKRALTGIGGYPELSLQEARDIRDKYRALLSQGIDPQQQKQKDEQAERVRIANTFKLVAENWRASKRGHIKDETLAKYWRIIEIYLLPSLADYPVSEITPTLVKPILEIPYKAGKAEMFRKSVKLLNGILNYAVYSLFLIPFNPCEKIISAFENVKGGRNPSIKPDELPELLNKLQDSNVDRLVRYLILWQLLTMVRPNEAVTAEWVDIDEVKGVWTIPAEKMKQTKANEGKAHIVPLSTQARALLIKIKAITGNSRYLFHSNRAKDGHLNKQTANKAISDIGYKGEQTAHGLRKIASTYLHEAGVLPDVVEMCLAHTINGIRGVYNTAEYLPHRKTALQKWGDFVEKCQKRANGLHLSIVA